MVLNSLFSVTCSKFISDVIMLVSSSMATRDRGSEGARFEILQASYRLTDLAKPMCNMNSKILSLHLEKSWHNDA